MTRWSWPTLSTLPTMTSSPPTSVSGATGLSSHSTMEQGRPTGYSETLHRGLQAIKFDDGSRGGSPLDELHSASDLWAS